MGDQSNPAVVGISGASGSIVARETIDKLIQMNIPVIATASSAARMVWREELDESFGDALERWVDSGQFTYYHNSDLAAQLLVVHFQLWVWLWFLVVCQVLLPLPMGSLII